MSGLVLRGIGFALQAMFSGLVMLAVAFILGFVGGVAAALFLAGWAAAWSLMR